MASCLPAGWRIKKIGELCKVARGSSPRPIADQKYFEGGTIPWIKIADATKSGKYLYVTKETVNEYGASFSRLLPKGSLIVAASGATLGYTQFLGVEGCVHDGWIYFSDYAGVEKDYLYYFFHWKNQYFFSQAYGAAIQNINTQILREMEISLPPFETQRKIASILSAYDDLIENNNHRIKILEEMARMVYREWFVNFRFPGHEQVKMVDSPLGMIPERWEVKALGEVCSVIKRGVSPKYDDGSESIVINQKCIRDFRLSLKDSRKHNSKVPAEKYLAQGDVLINSTGVGTLGRVAQVLQDIKDCTADSHVTIVRPKESVDTDFLGLQMFAMQEYFENLGQGATGQTELGRESIANTEVIVATKDVQEKFSATVKPMRWLAKRLAEKNEVLRQTRDLLLPKLISGEVAVREICATACCTKS